MEAGARTQVTVREIAAELNGMRVGVKDASRPLFEARRLFLEGGEVDLGARTFSLARVGLSEGHIDVGLDQQGKINWERLLAGRGKGAAHKESKPVSAADTSGSNPDQAVPEQLDRVGKESTTTGQPAVVQPSPAEEQPWMVNVEAVEIKDMAFGLEDMSRSSPVAAGIAGVSIGLKARIEAGGKTRVEVKEIATELKGLHLGVKGAPKPLFEAQRFVSGRWRGRPWRKNPCRCAHRTQRWSH